jgi:ABC-type phosphate transport system substrate-binding protein
LQDGVVVAVSRISNSIGYAGIDAAHNFGKLNSSDSCKVRLAKMINKNGKIVLPSASSAQAAVRSGLLVGQTTCPGFGLCGNIQDSGDADVWPITAISVRPSIAEMIMMGPVLAQSVIRGWVCA